jgi:putative membrane protein
MHVSAYNRAIIREKYPYYLECQKARPDPMRTLWLVILFGVLIWSGIKPTDTFTWFLEVLPVIIGIIVMGMTYKKFRLTTLAYVLILIHCVILMVGGHYTYAEVPLPAWINDLYGLERNNYDKIGHFAQGFIPAIIAREILVRKEIVNGPKWMSFIVVSICLAISAFYELIEWWVAALSGESAEAFLGTQGYVWDTQSDMGLALLGAIVSLIVFSRMQIRNT